LTTILLFAFAGTAVMAQCPPSPEPCPQVCAPVCPDPCCPETALGPAVPQCPCPQATPGALGAGPAPGLLDLECADFDKAYVERMYEQNTAVIALTTQGIQRSTSKNLRDISGEIRTQLTSENVKLDNWYEEMGCGAIPVHYVRAQTVVDSVREPRLGCFDVAYAKQLIGLLQQSKSAHELAMQMSTIPQVRWICRLERWVSEKGANIR